MLRYLNMFVLIGIALIIISLLGLATGNRLLTEPGQIPDPKSWLIYLGAGVLMLFNGALSILQSPPQPARPAPSKGAKPENRSDAPGSTEAETV